MTADATRRRKAAAGTQVDALAILNALSDPVMVLDGANRVAFVNMAGEQFFAMSAVTLLGRPFAEIQPEDSPVHSLIDQARAGGYSLSHYGVAVETAKRGYRKVSVTVSAVVEKPTQVTVTFREDSTARKIDHQLTHRSAARSVTAMAAMLAHEIKNPLSGIRGAAQLLEENASESDRALTRLICEEADRIVALVDRVEMFSDERPIEREAVNIHEVLDHVRRISEASFARGLEFRESYDPSLPPVYGRRDLLIQVVMNLVKNAAEACDPTAGEILLSTRYKQGVRLKDPGSGERIDLPLVVLVQDNGPGIPEDLQSHLFDPFVTTKANGKGLGLALVAKIVRDHGGIIEFDSDARGTAFRMMLPKAPVEMRVGEKER